MAASSRIPVSCSARKCFASHSPLILYLLPLTSPVIKEVLHRAKSRAEILECRVPYKGSLTRGRGRAGFDTSVLDNLVADPKIKWKERVESLATETYPRWRDLFRETGKRLPVEMLNELASRCAWQAERVRFADSILRWLGASTVRHRESRFGFIDKNFSVATSRPNHAIGRNFYMVPDRVSGRNKACIARLKGRGGIRSARRWADGFRSSDCSGWDTRTSNQR